MAFDLDNEELKATRRDKGLDDGLYEDKMSEADKLFEKLGYEIDKNEDRMVVYKTNCANSKIYLCVFHNTEDTRFKLKFYEQYCSMNLLHAINLKVKELGWI